MKILASTVLLVLLPVVQGCADLAAVDDADDLGKADDLGSLGQPIETLVDDLGDATPMVQDADHLYYRSAVWQDDVYAGETIYQLAKDGGEPVAMFAPEPIRTLQNPIAIAGDRLYWFSDAGDPGALRTIRIGDDAPETVLEGVENPLSIAADASGVYFTDQPQAEPWTYDLYEVTGVGAATLATGLAWPAALATDASDVLWVDSGPGNAAIGCEPGRGEVGRVSKLGGVPSVIAIGQGCPQDLATDGLNVYWINWLSGGRSSRPSLMAASKLGGFPVQKAIGAYGIALDATHVYFASDAGGLGRVRKLFGLPTAVVADADLRPVVDATHVYFWRIDASEGFRASIQRVEKR